LFSSLLFVITGLIGYIIFKFYGIILGVFIGYILGKFIKYSMGIRGKNPNHGFYIRLRERANGKRCHFLEYLIEKARGSELTRDKCVAITNEYDKALNKIKFISDNDEKLKVLLELDKRTKEIPEFCTELTSGQPFRAKNFLHAF
jgi:hypothetical protein